MNYIKIEGMLVKPPQKLKNNKKGEEVCKIVLFHEFADIDKPLKAAGITAKEALEELSAGDTIETICHETNRHYIVDIMLRKNKYMKGA